MMIVTKKPKPQPTASILSRLLLSTIRDEKEGDAYSNSEVINRIIAVTASHKLRSVIVRGKIIGTT